MSKITKDLFLESLLMIVPSAGWTKFALEQTELQLNLPIGYWKLLFEGELDDIIDYFELQIFSKMNYQLGRNQINSLTIIERIITIIKLRLYYLKPYKEVILQLKFYYIQPQNFFKASQKSWKIADEIWYQLNDQAVDFNYYSKRLILAKIYLNTINHWLADQSDNEQETWNYLEKQLKKVIKFGEFKKQIKNKLINIPFIRLTFH